MKNGMLIAITGGIGAGKSAASDALSGAGASVYDADAIVRAAQRRGGALYDAMYAAFGSEFFPTGGAEKAGEARGSGGELDRAKLARLVFSDAAALERLNALTAPFVRGEILKLRAEAGRGDKIIFVAIPLLFDDYAAAKFVRIKRAGADTGKDSRLAALFDAVWLIEAGAEYRRGRAAARDGAAAADIDARIKSQLSDSGRRKYYKKYLKTALYPQFCRVLDNGALSLDAFKSDVVRGYNEVLNDFSK